MRRINNLKRYDDFLFESLIRESLVVYGPTFKKLIKAVDSPVARGLEELENKDLTVQNNFIDFDKDDKEKISFIPDRRAQQMISPENKEKYAYHTGGGFLTHSPANQKMFDELGYTPTGDRTYHPNSTEKGEILKQHTSETSGKTYCLVQFAGGLSVINKENLRFEDVSNLPFLQNRQTIRIGRGIRGLLAAGGKNFTDAEIEQFVNKYKSEYDKMNDIFRDFEVVTGDKIAYWYHYRTYLHGRDRGPLSNSCMSGVPESYLEIYTKNPEVCSLLILKNEDGTKIKGRALVWELTEPSITFVDRIYTHADSDIELFRQYAKSEGWYCKAYNGSGHDSLNLITPTGNTENLGELTTKVKKGGYSSYPYLDTLQYLDRSNGILSTDNSGDSLYLIDTGGGYESDCDNCGGEGRVDCYRCDGSGEESCDNCDGNGRLDCEECNGTGEMECNSCDGKGEIDGEKCEDCNGKGKIDCDNCGGDGDIRCDVCRGSGDRECSRCDGNCYIDCPQCS